MHIARGCRGAWNGRGWVCRRCSIPPSTCAGRSYPRWVCSASPHFLRLALPVPAAVDIFVHAGRVHAGHAHSAALCGLCCLLHDPAVSATFVLAGHVHAGRAHGHRDARPVPPVVPACGIQHLMCPQVLFTLGVLSVALLSGLSYLLPTSLLLVPAAISRLCPCRSCLPWACSSSLRCQAYAAYRCSTGRPSSRSPRRRRSRSRP